MTQTTRQILDACEECGESGMTTQLDFKYPHFIDFLNGGYGPEGWKQDCWPSVDTQFEALKVMKAFHDGGHKKGEADA